QPDRVRLGAAEKSETRRRRAGSRRRQRAAANRTRTTSRRRLPGRAAQPYQWPTHAPAAGADSGVKTMRKTLLFVLLASALAAAHAADAPRETTIDAGDEDKSLAQSWNVTPGARIELDNVRGSVSVSGWDRPEVDLGGTLGSGSHLLVSGDADHL